VPGTKDELMSLPGVGDYVASAVACFSKGEPTPIIDTNVVRVIGRIFGLRLEGEARRRKEMRDAAAICLDRRQPRLYNYALLDFAALVCIASAPRCTECPFGQRGLCEYAQRKERLPHAADS
jgi:A/G-specific adenine glycosylase